MYLYVYNLQGLAIRLNSMQTGFETELELMKTISYIILG